MRHAFIQGAAALLALAPAPSLAARDVAFGFQAGIAFPAGPIRQDGIKAGGPSLGFHALVDLGGGHALRPRLEWTRNRGDHSEILAGGAPAVLRSTGAARTFSLGADYLFHPLGRVEGFYALAGLSLDAHRFDNTSTVDAVGGPGAAPLVQGRSAVSQVRPGLHVGLGWQFNRSLGLELRHGFSRVGGSLAQVAGTDHGAPFVQSEVMPSYAFRKTTLSMVVRF